MSATNSIILHASAVSFGGYAAVILGKSGAGKSSLALQMIGLGATLVADDRTEIINENDVLTASPAPNIKGKIEARHMGIIELPHAENVPIRFFVDLDQPETERLPPRRSILQLGQKAPLFHGVNSVHFAPALMQILRYGRSA